MTAILTEIIQEKKSKVLAKRPTDANMYVLDLDRINTLYAIAQTLELLDANGLHFVLDDKEAERFKNIIKKK